MTGHPANVSTAAPRSSRPSSATRTAIASRRSRCFPIDARAAPPLTGRRQHGGCFDLDLGAVLQKLTDDEQAHGREMPADYAAVDLADLALAGHIGPLVGHEPGEAGEVLGLPAR